MSRKTKEQAELIKIPAGTQIGNKKAGTIEFGKEFRAVTGINIVEIQDGSIPYYNLKVEDSTGQDHVDMTHKKTFEYDPNREYKSVDIPANDRSLRIQIDLPSSPSSDIIFVMNFRLENP